MDMRSKGTANLNPKRLLRRDDTPFFDWDGRVEPSVDVGAAQIELPIRYWRTDCFMGLFPADLDAVGALLPSDRLHPVRLTGNRAVLAVIAFNYLETGVGPYGEVGISPICTLDRQAPPLVPLAHGAIHGMSGFVAHLPVTSRIARQAGRQVWGYPKFVADMDFEFSPEAQQVTLAEGDQDILRMRVRRSGPVLTDNTPLTTFTVRDGRLIRTVVQMRGRVATTLGGGGGHVELGDHPVAGQLAGLGMELKPIATRTYLSHAAILPRGEDLGPADRAYEGYAGADRAFGRHTIRYDQDVVRTVTESSTRELAGSRGKA